MRLQHIAQRGCHSATCSSPPYAFAHAMARYRLRAHAPHGYRISLSYGSAHPTVAQNGPRWRHHAVQVTPFVGRPNDTKGWGEGAAEGAGDDDVDDEGDEDDDSDDDDGGTSRCRRAHRVKSVSKSESSRVLAPARDSTGGSRPGWPPCGKWHCKQEKESKEERQEEADDSAKDQRVPATHPQVWPPTSAPGLGSPLRPIRSRKCHRYRRRGWDVVQPAGSHGARYSGCAGCEYPGGTQAAQGVGAFKGLRLRRVWVPRRSMRRFNLVPNPRLFVGQSPADSEHYLLGSLSAPQQRWIVLQRVSVARCVVFVACCVFAAALPQRKRSSRSFSSAAPTATSKA